MKQYLGDAVAKARDDMHVLEDIRQEGHAPSQVHIDIGPRGGTFQTVQHEVLEVVE